MGAGQSSTGKSPEQEAKTSYYELLGVSRQATEEEIKKAYRRKALELHPDRNYGNEEHATKVFAEIQAAYEVLSDPQERAWYDSHETAILRGDDVDDVDGVPTYDNVRITTADDLARMVRKFNSGVEFTDAPSGFFGYLRETFEQLAKEEQIAASWDNADAPDYPSFGHKDDNYDTVVKRFYSAWSSFSTVKSFSWKDQYRLSEAPDRWYRRRMEQENKKLRQEGIREFNDAVRSFVAFVRKRDPRYIPSTQTEAERQKALRDATAAQAARARAANEAKMHTEVPQWARSQEPDPLAEMEGTFEDEEEDQEVFECVACNKIFKSERQWEAHERSKKHQKAVRTLQQKMRKDNNALDLDGEDIAGAATPDVQDECEGGVLEHISTQPESREIKTNGHAASEVDSKRDNLVEEQDRRDEDPAAPGTDGQSLVDDEAEQEADLDHSDNEDYASHEAILSRLQAATLVDGEPSPRASESEEDAPAAAKKMGKAAQKRAKKAAAAASGKLPEPHHQCAGCNAAFPTKSRLFQHLKDHPQHVALKKTAEGARGKKGGQTKR